MVITDIKQQLKLTDRYSIFIDGRYSFSLSSQQLLEQHLVKGQQIDQETLKSLQKIAADDKLYGLTLRYCTLRLHSQKEVELYLGRKKAEPKAKAAIIERLVKIGFIDDAAFAQTWINNRRQKFFSQRRIIQELRKKGVDKDVIAKAMEAEEPDDSEAVIELVRKKRQQAKYANDDLKLMRYLAQQGFNYDHIKKAVKG